MYAFSHSPPPSLRMVPESVTTFSSIRKIFDSTIAMEDNLS